MPPKLSLKRKVESKPIESEPIAKKVTESPKAKTVPRLKLSLTPLQCKTNKVNIQDKDANPRKYYQWQPLPASKLLPALYPVGDLKNRRDK